MSAMPAAPADQPLASPARPFRYGWVVLAIATVVIVLGSGTRAAPGALLLDRTGVAA